MLWTPVEPQLFGSLLTGCVIQTNFLSPNISGTIDVNGKHTFNYLKQLIIQTNCVFHMVQIIKVLLLVSECYSVSCYCINSYDQCHFVFYCCFFCCNFLNVANLLQTWWWIFFTNRISESHHCLSLCTHLGPSDMRCQTSNIMDFHFLCRSCRAEEKKLPKNQV